MRWEKHGTRDRTYSLWHRDLDDELHMIDIDSCEFCVVCKQPLALIETAIDVGQDKKTYYTENLARAAAIPAYVLLYSGHTVKHVPAVDGREHVGVITQARVRRIYHPDRKPSGWRWFTPDELAAWIRDLRKAHPECYADST